MAGAFLGACGRGGATAAGTAAGSASASGTAGACTAGTGAGGAWRGASMMVLMGVAGSVTTAAAGAGRCSARQPK
jgi:hypothetical protein